MGEQMDPRQDEGIEEGPISDTEAAERAVRAAETSIVQTDPAGALARHQQQAAVNPFEWWDTPRSFDEAMGRAVMLAESGLVPKDYVGKANAAKIVVACMKGRELGLNSPFAALESISVINGRACIWGDGMLAVVQVHPDFSGHKEWYEGDPRSDTFTACCHVKRRNRPDVVRTFSIADAKQANLWGKQGPWQGYPQRMLQMRARSWALRDQFADALKGLKMAEEIIDVTPEEQRTAAVDVRQLTAPRVALGAERKAALDVEAVVRPAAEQPSPVREEAPVVAPAAPSAPARGAVQPETAEQPRPRPNPARQAASGLFEGDANGRRGK